MLNQFIHNLLKSSTVVNYPGIQTMVEQFLEQRPEDKKALLSGHLVKTVDNLLFNPLKVVGNVVKTVPDNIFNTVDGVMDNISKVLGPSKPANRLLVDEVSKLHTLYFNEIIKNNFGRTMIICLCVLYYCY